VLSVAKLELSVASAQHFLNTLILNSFFAYFLVKLVSIVHSTLIMDINNNTLPVTSMSLSSTDHTFRGPSALSPTSTTKVLAMDTMKPTLMSQIMLKGKISAKSEVVNKLITSCSKPTSQQ
jgi:hypothetical protein